MQASPTVDPANSTPEQAGFLARFITRDRVEVGVHVSSKKRLLEEVADLLTMHSDKLDRDTVFQVLNERERLGSTGVGEGFALPHGRVNGIEDPIICAMSLSQPLDFDAIDDKPIQVVIGLLVPADANKTHLQILAKLAGAFRDEVIRESLIGCESQDELLSLVQRLD